MRFLPLIPSSYDPGPWRGCGALALRWEGSQPAWRKALQEGLLLPAVLLPGADLLAEGLEVLQAHLEPDFLLLPVELPPDRAAGFRLLGALEALLEATSGRGVKLALRLAPGSEQEVLALLKQARAEAVGFCWHPGILDAEPLADRLWFGLCEPHSDLGPLQRLGYRWDMALPAQSPEGFRQAAAALAAAHPPVLFPAVLPTTALGRPVRPDESVVFGSAWGSKGPQP